MVAAAPALVAEAAEQPDLLVEDAAHRAQLGLLDARDGRQQTLDEAGLLLDEAALEAEDGCEDRLLQVDQRGEQALLQTD